MERVGEMCIGCEVSTVHTVHLLSVQMDEVWELNPQARSDGERRKGEGWWQNP